MKLSTHLSVVIPSKNEEDYILTTLKSLNEQCGTKDLRVFIADSSTDATVEKIYQFMASPENHLAITVVPGGLPSEARNTGSWYTRTPYVLFLDSDMFFKERKHLYTEFNQMLKSDLELVTCSFRTTSRFYSFSYSIFEIFQRFISKSEPFAVGGYMMFKKEAFDRVGGFNERDKFAEDFSLSRKIDPAKFEITHRKIYTSPRRLQSKGLLHMTKLMVKTWIKRNQPAHYQKDHGYWNK
jgi:glycosyltransferase involved in cell wall biosynthesis